jgi:long-chain acyl-CoA synthetase
MISLHRTAAALWLAACLALPGAHAAEVAGVRFEERMHLGGQALQLQGAGLRSRLFVKVYAAALYVPQRPATAAAIIDDARLRRLQLRMLRDIPAETLLTALEEGLAANSEAAELETLRPQTLQFAALMRGLGKVREGDTVGLDFSAEGVLVSLNGEMRGKVAGVAFGKALLRVWLGEKPADAGLKKALLGD